MRSLLAGIGAIALAFFALGVAVRILGPAIPSTQLNQVKYGMPRETVELILGQAQQEHGSTLYYSQFGNPGWVEVRFDDNWCVVEVNDESIFVKAME